MVTIAHPTTATEDDAIAFEHAAALAQRANAKLISLYVSRDPKEARLIPDAAALVARWGGNAIAHEKVVHNWSEDDVAAGVLDALKGLQPDLVVAKTHRRGTVSRLLTESYAEAIASNISIPSLMIPSDTDGFVASATGALSLSRVLVPMGDAEEASAAIERTTWLLDLARVSEAEVVLLRVGSGDGPAIQVPERNGWTFERTGATGSVEDAILAEAERASIAIMATRGHDSVGDVIVGSHTERVLHRANCPVLSVPI